MIRVLAPTCCLLLLLTACGGGDPPPPEAPETPEAAPDEEPDEEARRGVTRGNAASPSGPRAPQVARIGIFPAEPTVTDDLTADSELAAGASPYTNVTYTWVVNDRDVLGVSKPVLPAGEGWFRRGDRVRVRATARDENGLEGGLESKDLVVVNSVPDIKTDLATARRMDGVTLQAEDADDDRLTWSLQAGPPGLEITALGRIRVRPVDLKEAWEGEAVFVVDDGFGGRQELHIPVSINAAQAGRVEEETVQKRVASEKMSEEEWARREAQEVERVQKMTPEEYQKYLDDREKRSGR